MKFIERIKQTISMILKMLKNNDFDNNFMNC